MKPETAPVCPDCGSSQFVFVCQRGHSARLECEGCRTTYHVEADGRLLEEDQYADPSQPRFRGRH